MMKNTKFSINISNIMLDGQKSTKTYVMNAIIDVSDIQQFK